MNKKADQLLNYIQEVFLMTSSGLIAIAAALCIALSTIAPAIGQGMTASKAMDAIARQPEAAGDIRSTLILSMGLMEALTIYGLLIAFMLVAKI
jgi:F-type H+-transporting ATPase subunit c